MPSSNVPGLARRVIDALFRTKASDPGPSPEERLARARAGFGFDGRTPAKDVGYDELKKNKPEGPVSF